MPGIKLVLLSVHVGMLESPVEEKLLLFRTLLTRKLMSSKIVYWMSERSTGSHLKAEDSHGIFTEQEMQNHA